MNGKLIIQQPGISVVTDLGRFRGARYGLPVNGALDQQSARIANILVGNGENAPLIEVTALDFRMQSDADILISVTGAPASLTVGGQPRSQWEPVSVRAGETVAVRGIRQGLRVYLAVYGAVRAPTLLGSCAPDTVIGFGLRLERGTELELNRSCPPIRQPFFDLPLFRLGLPHLKLGSELTIDVTDGPDVEDFGDTAQLLYTTTYTVSERSNHIGLRLGGQLPERQTSGELLSRGVPVGAIEVPSRNELLVLHRGRGVTAGYPVLAVVTSASLDTLAQARPGSRIRFRRTTVEAATAEYRRLMNEIEYLRNTITTVFRLLGVGETAQWQELHYASGF